MNKKLLRLTGTRLRIMLALLTLAIAQAALARGERLSIDHYFELNYLSEPRLSPEGDWIAYTVARHDLDEDESGSRIWMVPTAGGDAIAMTAKAESSSRPRWSPDGKYLAFLSSRDDGKTQVWTLNRVGGEAVQLTDTAQSVQSFDWSPDSKRMLLVLRDPTAEETAAKEQGDHYEETTAKPWVINREQFKTDYVGYLDRRRKHIYTLDIASGDIVQLTFGDYDDSSPAWSPEGSRIAFTSNRTKTPDLNYNSDIWVVSSTPTGSGKGAALIQVTTQAGEDDAPAWSPDGLHITHTSVTHPETSVYSTRHLAISNASGGGFKLLTGSLDRMVSQPEFSAKGDAIYFLLEDSGEQILAKMGIHGGEISRLVSGQQVVYGFDQGAAGRLALLVHQPQQPGEIFLLQGATVEQRSFANRELLASLQLGAVVEVQFKSADGTPIEGFIIKPPGFKRGKKYPTILDIHGGPQAQYDFSFNYEAQLLAANGYLVVHPNPRGSTGYGREFCLAIWQDWGGPDYEDVMAAVDDAIARGWADPKRLGVMGWSYGGMLTNHIITKTARFKAAITGASATLYAVNYGHDMYFRWWEQELGFPWEPGSREIYERMSPFNQVDKVSTPTLVVGGEVDWNVPIINSEQLYLALKRLGVDTELVVYPGEYHNFSTPSYIADLYQRYLDWFGDRI